MKQSRLWLLVGLIATSVASNSVAAPNDGSGARGSAQRKAYCGNALLDCQYAVDDNCRAHPEKGAFCEADGYAVCNTLHDKCLAKASVSGTTGGGTGTLLHSPGN